MTAAEIARRPEQNTSELLRNLPGVHVERISEADTASAFFSRTSTTTAMSDKQVTMRGTFSEKCIPALFINGHRLPVGISAEDLDFMVRPEEVIGIEVYTGGTAPGQFQNGLSGCGSVVIWRR